jgi:DNA modification methylase
MTRKEVAGLSKLEINSVHQGDCLELMKNIADGSVDSTSL